MKNTTIFKLSFYLFLSTSLFFNTSCDEEDDNPAPDLSSSEGKYVRLVAKDAETAKFYFLNPAESKINDFNLSFPGFNIYTTNSGRFAFILHRENNLVQVFDSGIEIHNDHAHGDKEAKLLDHLWEQAQPTHFYSLGKWIVIFNDGDGSVTLIDETQAHKVSYKPSTYIVSAAHHGAAVPFNNNTFAVSVKDPNASGALPQQVKIIDQFGKTIAEPVTKVGGIHGDASNGNWAAFGSTDGVLVVKSDGTSKLVNNVAPLENTSGKWIGTILGHPQLNHFYGRSSMLGIFKIDYTNNSISPVLPTQTNSILAQSLDHEGKELFVLLKDGSLKIFDAVSATEKHELTNLFPAYTEGPTPSFSVSEKFIYIANPASGEVNSYNRKTYTRTTATLEIDGKPVQLKFAGSDFDSGSH